MKYTFQSRAEGDICKPRVGDIFPRALPPGHRLHISPRRNDSRVLYFTVIAWLIIFYNLVYQAIGKVKAWVVLNVFDCLLTPTNKPFCHFSKDQF